MTTTSWVVAQSEHALKQSLRKHSKHKLYDNVSSKEILPRRLKFMQAKHECNARPMAIATISSSVSSSVSSSSSVDEIRGRQHSGFQPAAQQLFDEERILPLMSWSRTANSVGGGLRNLGNSCFMNSTLQCLCYTAPFQNYIATNDHSKRCKTSGWCIFCEMQTLMPDMLNGSHSTSPSAVFKNLRLLSKKLRPGRQEDSQEFLRFLIEALHNACLAQEHKKIKDMRVQETTFIHKLWGGYLRSQIKCCKCGYESNTYDSILDVSLEIKGSSVRSAFSHFTDAELLDDDNKYQCDHCNKKRRAVKQFSIFEAPNILVVHLKRFESGGGGLFSGGKINAHVKFETTLDLTEFMSYQTSTKVSYSLIGVLVHYGYSSHGGHYVSYVRAPNSEQWYLMDDSSVRPVPLQTVLKEKAYLLFYQRNEPKVLYVSPHSSPSSMVKKQKSQSRTATPKQTTSQRTSSRLSMDSLHSLRELADHLPQTRSMFEKKKSTPKITKTKNDRPSPRIAATSTSSTPKSTTVKRISIRDRDADGSDSPKLEWQKNKHAVDDDADRRTNVGEKRKHSNPHVSTTPAISVDDFLADSISMPAKKRKTMSIECDNNDDAKSTAVVGKLKLLKRKIERTKPKPQSVTVSSCCAMNACHSNSSTSSTLSVSSSPSCSSSWKSHSVSAVSHLRRMNANKLVGRRSHSLKLAAKTSLHSLPSSRPPHKFHRTVLKDALKDAVDRDSKFHRTVLKHDRDSKFHRTFLKHALDRDHNSKLKHTVLRNAHECMENKRTASATMSDSSDSVLSDTHSLQQQHKPTPYMVSDDSSDSLSPQAHSPHSQLDSSSSGGNTNTTLPAHDNIASYRHHKPTLITDESLIKSYLDEEAAASRSSAVGIGNVSSWGNIDTECESARKIRERIIESAKEPIVEPKDEWDIELDTANPRKSKKKDVWQEINYGEYVNEFQATQQRGTDTLKKAKKKKKIAAHNHNRLMHRQKMNSLQT